MRTHEEEFRNRKGANHLAGSETIQISRQDTVRGVQSSGCDKHVTHGSTSRFSCFSPDHRDEPVGSAGRVCPGHYDGFMEWSGG